MSLKGEFISSFGSYVSEDGDDSRRSTLVQMLKLAPAQLINYMEPHDLAALLTCVVSVDPRPPAAQRLMRELHAWEEARLRAEEDYEDPDVIAFDPRVDDVEFAFDESLPGLARFLEAVKIAKRDNRFGRILVCLMWARGIQKMIPNLYNPKGRK